MNKRISFFIIKEKIPWPNSIKKRFGKYISKFGVPYFEVGSKEEEEFIEECLNHNLTLTRKTVWQCTGKDLNKHPFYYLSVKVHNNIKYDEDFMDYSNACNECGWGTNRIGAKQIKKIKLNYDKLKLIDITYLPNTSEHILLVSKRLKELMEPMKFKGYTLIPCLDSSKQYSEKEEKLTYQSEELEKDAKYFQLIVTNKVNNPPFVGMVENFLPPCQNCKSFRGFFISISPFFRQGDLKEVDFQYFSEYDSENFGRFSLQNYSYIISSNFFSFLIGNKVKLDVYMTDPPVKYGVVEIWCLNRHE